MADRLEIDMTLLAELFEDIDRHPPGIETRKVLIEQYINANWSESAIGAIEELYKLRPNDTQVRQWHAAYCSSTSKSPIVRNVSRQNASSGSSRQADDSQNTTHRSKATGQTSTASQSRFASLRKGALSLFKGLTSPSATQPRQNTQPLTESKNETDPEVVELARRMKSDPFHAEKIAMDELEKSALVLEDEGNDEDCVRDIIYKRVESLVAILPADLSCHPRTALMHLDHEKFHKKYVNTETMYGDDVVDIPRANFLATEDGYAWDMEELQQAIISGKGVMRNPLSKNMFTPADVQAILRHPLGKDLGALQVEQRSLRKGVRPKTIEEMDRIATILLEDMADDAMASRKAVDEFMAYIATLPAHEQTTLDNLRVPARDSHTYQAFDGSIGETIRDAKGNQICFHKAGDFMRQAASHLRRSS